MFSIFKKDPVVQLRKEYGSLLEKALAAQRNGDIRGYSALISQSEELAQEIDKLESSQR